MYLALTAIHPSVALGLGKVRPLVPVIPPFASMNWIVIPFDRRGLDENLIAEPVSETTTLGVRGRLLTQMLPSDSVPHPSAYSWPKV
jgi:hypothetical protein